MQEVPSQLQRNFSPLALAKIMARRRCGVFEEQLDQVERGLDVSVLAEEVAYCTDKLLGAEGGVVSPATCAVTAAETAKLPAASQALAEKE